MSESDDARAERKAQTRLQIRRAAQQLFADRGFDNVTVNGIAAAAAVSVQTIFNHFTGKEDLFFDGRTDWVTGPADAVRNRPPGVRPLIALREYLVAAAADMMRAESTPEGDCFVQALAASPSLSTYKHRLAHQGEKQLREALLEAWQPVLLRDAPADDHQAAAVIISATWLAAVRGLVVAQRCASGPGKRTPDEFARLTHRTLSALDEGLREALTLADGVR